MASASVLEQALAFSAHPALPPSWHVQLAPPSMLTCMSLAYVVWQDVLAAGADVIAAQKIGASRDKAYMLHLELEALCMFANGMTYRVSKAVYQRLCEVVASFS
eukprot:359219-Chlamydomonas_euryale.AAC.24